MVVAVGRTTTNQLDGALEALETVGSKVAGVVLTMVPTKGADAYAYGYGYGYGGYGSYQASAKPEKKPRRTKSDAGTQASKQQSRARRSTAEVEGSSFDDLLNPR